MTPHSNEDNMTYTLEELKEYMAEHLDELEIIEYLEISTTSLVNSYEFDIMEKYDFLIEKLGLNDWEEGEDD